MGTILGKGFAHAQVHTEFIAQVPSAMKLYAIVLVQNYCPNGEITLIM